MTEKPVTTGVFDALGKRVRMPSGGGYRVCDLARGTVTRLFDHGYVQITWDDGGTGTHQLSDLVSTR